MRLMRAEQAILSNERSKDFFTERSKEVYCEQSNQGIIPSEARRVLQAKRAGYYSEKSEEGTKRGGYCERCEQFDH